MHNINLDTSIYESPDFADSEDHSYSKINTDKVVQDITQATQSIVSFDGQEYAKTIRYPQKTGTNSKQWMLIVTLLVLFVLDGLQIAFIVFNKASHEKHAGRIHIYIVHSLCCQTLLVQVKEMY